jgi:hypothetical protein
LKSAARVKRDRRRGAPAPVEVWTASLEAEPAVRAWAALGGGPLPERLELLRRRQKSVIYRLPGVGPAGTHVIAKQSPWEVVHDERAAYEMLETLDVPRLGYYGFHAEPSRKAGWLFLEDAEGTPWDPEDEEHRQLCTRWLATVHSASSRQDGVRRLPDRGLGWYRRHLDGCPARIRKGFSNEHVPTESHPVLDDMLRLLDEVAGYWPEIEAGCAPMPLALAHGDFAERNIRVRLDPAGVRLLAYDWEVGGWGLPGVDLVDVDLAAYRAAVCDVWPSIEVEDLRRFAHLGQLLRGGIVSTSWASESLTTHWTRDVLLEFPHYARRIHRALDALGWRRSG